MERVGERVGSEGPHVGARNLTDDSRTKDDRTHERSKKEPNVLWVWLRLSRLRFCNVSVDSFILSFDNTPSVGCVRCDMQA